MAGSQKGEAPGSRGLASVQDTRWGGGGGMQRRSREGAGSPRGHHQADFSIGHKGSHGTLGGSQACSHCFPTQKSKTGFLTSGPNEKF